MGVYRVVHGAVRAVDRRQRFGLRAVGHPYPFLFLNWLLTVVSTFQSPLILLSQNRQNEMDRDRMRQIMTELRELRKAVEQLKA